MSWRGAALALVFIWFFFGGVAHFVWLSAYAAIVPAWMPYPREVAWLTGLTDIAGAIGILWLRTRRTAGYALILYCLCVWPVHFDMLAHADHYRSLGLPLLWLRLLFQPVVMAIIWLAAAPAPDSPKTERTPA